MNEPVSVPFSSYWP